MQDTPAPMSLTRQVMARQDARLAQLEAGFLAAQANADHYRRKNEVLAAEVEAYRASFLEALQHIENALLASGGKDLPLRVVRKYLNRYEMEAK